MVSQTSSVIVSSKGKKPIKTKQTSKQTKTQNIPSSNAVQFQYIFQCEVVVQSSHQRKRKEKIKKKRGVWRSFCECVSGAAAHLPTAVSLLLLEALFMQISGVSLTLT
jgi:hypothetical protein